MFKKFTYAEVTSTNDIAKKLLDDEKAVMVSAGYQTKGKGRNGKKWIGSNNENIYVSFGLKKENGESSDEIPKYQMLGSLAVLKTLREIAPNVKFSLKYPNDVIAQNSFLKGKISGILCENEFMGMLCFKTVIGIGINVSQEKFEEVIDNTPVSLKNLDAEIDTAFIIELLSENIALLLKETRQNILEMWSKELDIKEKKIALKGSEGEWNVAEILPDGRLKVFKNDESRIIDNGDSIRYL